MYTQDDTLNTDAADQERQRRQALLGQMGDKSTDPAAPSAPSAAPAPSPAPSPPPSPPPTGGNVTTQGVRVAEPDTPPPPPTVTVPPPPDSPANPGQQYPGGGTFNEKPAPPTTPTGTGAKPTGGSLTDPGYVDQLLAWWGQQPGVNPSVKNDPGYWKARMLAVGGDQGYWESRFMQPEGPPEGAGGTNGGTGGGTNQFPPGMSDYYAALTKQIQDQQQQNAGIREAQRQAMLRLMEQGQQPVDVQNDATLGPASAAYRLAATQQGKQTREALAERAAAEGLNSGGQGSGSFDSAVQGENEHTQQNIAGYDANLAVNELQNRRQMLVQALGLAQSFGAQQDSNQLQTQIMMLDNQIKQQTLAQNQSQFQDTTAFNYANLIQQANAMAMYRAMYGG